MSKSLDGGDEFTAASEGLTETALTAPLVLDANDGQRLWAGGRFVWRTLDGAAQWTQASAALPGSAENRVSALAVSAANSSFALAGTREGYILRTQEAFNVNADSVWHSAKPRAGRVSSLSFDPYNANTAYATYATESGAQVWRTRDGGANWESLSDSLPDAAAHQLIVDPSNPARLYLATELGLFVSLAAGEHWAVEETGFGAAPVTALVVDAQSTETMLYAFTHGRGVWRVSWSALASTAQQCTYAIAPVSLRFDATGGTGSVNVTTQANCAWTVANSNNWISITSGATGTGNGTVAFTVTANATRELRTGALTIAGRTFTVEQTGQGGNCVVTPLPSDQPVTGTLAAGDCLSRHPSFSNLYADRYSFTGQAGQFVVITMAATTNTYFPTLALFAPNGSVVAEGGANNNLESRLPSNNSQNGLLALRETGTYTIEAIAREFGATGDYRLTLTIYPAGCDVYTLTPARQAFAATSGSGSVQVAAGRNCLWTAATTANWITITSGALGTGSLPVHFTVAPNNGVYRTATVNVGPQSFFIEQGAIGGNCVAQTITSGQLVEGSLDDADCDLPQRSVGTGSRFYGDRYRFSALAGQKLSLSLVPRGNVTPLVY